MILVFGGIRRVWSIMSISNLVKRLIQIANNNNSSILTAHCSKNGPNIKKSKFKVVLLHCNAPANRTKPVRDMLETLIWEVKTYAAYSPDLVPSDYHLFSSLGKALRDQGFKIARVVKKWVYEWISSKPQEFFWLGIQKLTERCSECVASNGKYFENKIFGFSSQKLPFFSLKKGGI